MKRERKIALPVLGALFSVLLLGGFDGCNIYIQPYAEPDATEPEGEPDGTEPDVQPEPPPEPAPNPEPWPEPWPEPNPEPGPECFSDQDCPNGTVCVFVEGEDCWDTVEPICDPDGDGQENCAPLVAPCGYGQCMDVEPPQCEEDCFTNYEAFIQDCLGNGGMEDDPNGARPIDPDGECFRLADEFLGQCLDTCEEPPPPPFCEDECFQRFDQVLEECFQNGNDDEDCFRAAEEELNYCLMDCDEPPPPPQCEDDCFRNYEDFITNCLDGSGMDPTDPNGSPIAPPDDECFRLADEFLGQCLETCDEPPPPPFCEEDCFIEFEEILRECEQAGDEECFRFAEENLDFCLINCTEPPPPPQCEETCFIQYEEFINNCYGDGTTPGANPEGCEQAAEEFLNYCLMDCSEPPPPPTCEDECERNVMEAFEECLNSNQDPEFCEQILGPLFDQCLQECNNNNGECQSDADCGDDQRCEIVEWCVDGCAPGEDCIDLPYPCGTEGFCVDTNNNQCNSDDECGPGAICSEGECLLPPPPPEGCNSDADCGEGGRCEVQEYCYFYCDANDPECCFEEGQCVEDDTVCIQVEVEAADPATGNCEVFPTPCDVPDGFIPCGQP